MVYNVLHVATGEQKVTEVFHTKSVHGSLKFKKLDKGYELCLPNGNVFYRSFRSMHMALKKANRISCGVRDSKITLRRYLGEIVTIPDSEDVLSVFSAPIATIVVQPKAGIDLDKRGKEVAKLFYAGFAKQLISGGFSPEDVLQELYKGILIRNSGKCPFDPSKSSFGHYVHMVANCVISNYCRKHNRYKSAEVYKDFAEDDKEGYSNQFHDYKNAERSLIAKEGIEAIIVAANNSVRKPSEDITQRLVAGLKSKEIKKELLGMYSNKHINKVISAFNSAKKEVMDSHI